MRSSACANSSSASRRRDEKWVGGIVGLVTGVISAATGVQVIPSMPYFQAIGMEKDELVQALGVFFTVATVALAFNLSSAGLLDESTALPGVVALACSFTGMAIGQAVRTRMEPDAFRRWFLIAMIFLGIYLAGSAIYNLARRLRSLHPNSGVPGTKASNAAQNCAR